MDGVKAPGGAGLSTKMDTEARDIQAQNAIKQFQAVYGEKPKEARPIKKQLDKDDFMKIMITEMKHQDPTKPMDSDRMATQMAQITSVEQMKNVSNAIEKLADKNSASDRMAMSAMIGKSITVDKSRFNHQKGSLSSLNFDLPEDAEKIKITVLNEKGDEVAKRDLEPMKAGSHVYNWDGVNESQTPSLTGTYMIRVDAENAKGSKIKIDPISHDSIVGVSFEGGETNFLVGDQKSPQRVAFKNVIRIDSGNPQGISTRGIPVNDGVEARERTSPIAAQSAPQAEEGAENAVQAQAPKVDALPPGLKEKLQAELASRDAKQVEAKPEGFPNGLGD